MNRTMLGIGAALLLSASWAVSQTQEGTLAGALKTSYEAEKNGDYQAAIKPLAALGASGTSAYVAQLRLGWLNYCAKDWAQSMVCYGRASQLEPFSVEPLLGRMLAQQAAGKNEDALQTAELVLRRDPKNYTATSHIAWLLYQKRDFQQAAIMYRKLVSLYPADTEMLLGLGFSLMFAGERKEAVQHFNTVLLLSPDNSRALEGLRAETVEEATEARRARADYAPAKRR